MKAVIMAGGEGTRLRPLTCNLPKPMVPILNRPMMEHIINLLKRHGFTSVASTLWYLPDHVTDYFLDGARFGLNMEYYVEREPLGTAGSVKNAVQFLTDTFVVVSGDALTDIDLSAAVRFHKKKGSVATLILTRVSNPLSYGVVLTDNTGKITQFLEKPSWSQVFSDTVNTGIYILEPEVLDLVSSGKKVDFSQDVFPELLRRGAPLYGYVASGYWSDIGNLEVYRQAQQDCLDGKVHLELPTPQQGKIYLEEEVHIHPEARIEGPVYVGKGSRIGPRAFVGPYSVLGPHSQIGPNASLKQSVLWSGVKVGAYAQLRGCICAQNVQVESETEVYEGAVLGEKVHLGTMSTISPNTKVWPEKKIPSGTRLRQSLVWGSQEQASLFSKRGIAGDFRGSLTPETITQVGLSYAAFLGQGKKVLVTSDYSRLGELSKQALVLGLRGGGLDVYDGGDVVGQLTRFAVQQLNLDGALHCVTSPTKPNQIHIECWNERGRLLSKSDQRKIEGLFAREDYPRQGSEDLGGLVQAPDLSNSYLQSLAQHYKAKTRGYKVGLVFDSEPGPFGKLVKDFLGSSGYAVVTDSVENLPTIVVQDQDWFFQDEQGTPLSADGWWRMFVTALKERNQTEVAVPVQLSQTVAQTAKQQGLKVRWTQMEPLFWMEAATELGNTRMDEEREVFPHIEPLASIGELLSFLSSQEAPLSSWQQNIHQETDQVHCPWEEKGRVMRELIESSDPERTLYLDGIKEHYESSWALVVPDGDEPIFRLYSEGETQEEAAGLIQHYSDLIESYKSEER